MKAKTWLVEKRQPYQYNFYGTIIKSWRKLYKQDGLYGYKNGDFFEPCGPSMMFKISMAQLGDVR